MACASVFGLGDQFCCWGGICSIRLRVAGERELLTEWRSLCVLHLLRFWYASDISNERGRKRIKKKGKKSLNSILTIVTTHREASFSFPFFPSTKKLFLRGFFFVFSSLPSSRTFLEGKICDEKQLPFPTARLHFSPTPFPLSFFFSSLVSKVAVPAHDLSTPFPHSPQRRRRGIRNWTNARPTAVGTLSSPFCIVSWTAFQNLPPFSPFPIHPTVRIAQLRVSQERQLGGTPALICCIDTCITHTCMRNYVPDRTHLIRRG